MTTATLNTAFNMEGLDEALAKIESISPSIAQALRQAELLNKSLSKGDILKDARARLDSENRRLRTEFQVVNALGEEGVQQAKLLAAQIKVNAEAREKLSNEMAVNTALERQQRLQMQAAAQTERAAKAAAVAANQNKQQGLTTGRFYTGNIAAQFQDVAVTAAMGMNPLQIALQQGTQLAAVLALMEKPLSGLVVGFKNLFGATSLMTIGLVAGSAALLQWINWQKVATTTGNALATTVEKYGSTIVYASTATAAFFAVINAGAILTTVGAGFTALTGAVVGATVAIRTAVVAAGMWIALEGVWGAAMVAMGAAMATITAQALILIGAIAGVLYAVDKFANDGKALDAISMKLDATMKSLGKTIRETFAPDLDEKTKKFLKFMDESRIKLEQERELLLLSGEAHAIAAAKQELMNFARQNEIELTQQQIEKITQLAIANGKAAYSNEQLAASQDLAKSSLRGFVADMKTGLKNGESFFDSFQNAAVNALDKILDKFLDFAVDDLFAGIGGAAGGGGLFGGLLGGFNPGKSITGLLGFASGGYTGDGPRSKFAGFNHGQEYVVNADATARHRPLLEAINAGQDISRGFTSGGGAGAQSAGMTVIVNNNAPGVDVSTSQTDEGTMINIARRVVAQDAPKVIAGDLANPNSRTSKSLSRNTETSRRR